MIYTVDKSINSNYWQRRYDKNKTLMNVWLQFSIGHMFFYGSHDIRYTTVVYHWTHHIHQAEVLLEGELKQACFPKHTKLWLCAWRQNDTER